MNKDQCFNLGHVVKAIGLKGECSILLDVDDPSRYKKLESVFIEINKKLVPFFIDHISLRHNNFAGVQFKNITNQDQANQLSGCDLYLPLEFLPQLDDKSFYFHEIQDYMVIDQVAGEIGPIKEVQEVGPSILGICTMNQREVIVPLQKIFIHKVDRANKILYTNLPEGLVDVYLNDHENDEKDV